MTTNEARELKRLGSDRISGLLTSSNSSDDGLFVHSICVDLETLVRPSTLRSLDMFSQRELQVPLCQAIEKSNQPGTSLRKHKAPGPKQRHLTLRGKSNNSDNKKAKSSFSPNGRNTLEVNSGNRGYALCFLIALLPLVLSIMTGASVLCLSLVQKAKFLHLCRTSILSAQEQLNDSITKLMQLNPQAKKLRRRAKHLRILAKNPAVFPIVRVGAKAMLIQVRVQQIQLNKKQRQIIATGKSQARTTLTKAGGNGGLWHNSPVKMAMIPVPPHSLSPSYIRSPGFDRLQQIDLSFQKNFHTFIPNWLADFGVDIPNLKGGCSATIKHKGGSWQESLSKDKY